MGNITEITEYGLERFEEQRVFIQRILIEILEQKYKEKDVRIERFHYSWNVSSLTKCFFVKYYAKLDEKEFPASPYNYKNAYKKISFEEFSQQQKKNRIE